MHFGPAYDGFATTSSRVEIPDTEGRLGGVVRYNSGKAVYLPQPDKPALPPLNCPETSGLASAVAQRSNVDVSLRLDLTRVLVKFGFISTHNHLAVTN